VVWLLDGCAACSVAIEDFLDSCGVTLNDPCVADIHLLDS